MLKCIIVDDEQFSIDILAKYIALMPNMVLTDVFTDSVQALTVLSAAEPTDLLFLDIHMPEISGLELAEVLRSKTKKLVFTTAHAKYAFEAYELSGDAFLLKPYSFEKFSGTVGRLFAGDLKGSYPGGANNDYFLIKSKENDLAIVKVRFADVVMFESSQNYMKIHLRGGKIITAYLALNDILHLLNQRPDFLQLHRSFIVSTDAIERIKGYQVQMSNQVSFTVGESYKQPFSAFISEKLMLTSRKH